MHSDCWPQVSCMLSIQWYDLLHLYLQLPMAVWKRRTYFHPPIWLRKKEKTFLTTLCFIPCTFTYCERGSVRFYAKICEFFLSVSSSTKRNQGHLYFPSEVLLVEIKSGSRSVAHVKWQFLQFFGKCRSPTVKYPCVRDKTLMVRMANTWSMLNK